MTAPRKSKSFGSGVPMGVPHMDLNIYDQSFKVRGKMSGVRLLHVMSAMDGNSEDGATITQTILNFLSDAFLSEDRERGMEYLRASDPGVELPMLLEIIQWLVEQYTGNPTQPPTPSTSGSTNAGSGSLGNAPSGAVTYVPSTENSSSLSEQPTLPGLS